ncbi:hypothetical protein LIA77_00394 [Sarocladium implicatum]|nr:hypothetical protein LIA77_00394 [Sarocladium implicatum]
MRALLTHIQRRQVLSRNKTLSWLQIRRTVRLTLTITRVGRQTELYKYKAMLPEVGVETHLALPFRCDSYPLHIHFDRQHIRSRLPSSTGSPTDMKHTTLFTVTSLLGAATAQHDYTEDWAPLLKEPTAMSVRNIKGYNVSQEYPGKELDGWKAYVKIRDQLPEESRAGRDMTATLSWIGILPPDEIERTGGSDNETQHIEADDSWNACVSGFAFYSSEDEIDADCGNVLSECMDFVKKTARDGTFCQVHEDMVWDSFSAETGTTPECKFERGVSRYFHNDDSAFLLSNRTVAGMNTTGPWQLESNDPEERCEDCEKLVYFVSVDWTRNGNGTSSRADRKSDQVASSYVCMRADSLKDEDEDGDDEGAASSRGLSLLMVMGFAAAAAAMTV